MERESGRERRGKIWRESWIDREEEKKVRWVKMEMTHEMYVYSMRYNMSIWQKQHEGVLMRWGDQGREMVCDPQSRCIIFADIP